MRQRVRVLTIVLLAAFAAGTVAGAAGAALMGAQMALAGGAAMDMDDCDGCPGDGESQLAACDSECLTTLLAVPVCDGSIDPPLAAVSYGTAMQRHAGRTGPPDPSPPKPAALS